MQEGKFRFAPDILRRLGEELNPYPDRGILELAKNAYDADAITCRIVLTNTDHAGGSVTVTDDGKGMSIDEILSGWLVLGSSEKKARNKTELGRIPSGSKGLGRLAALRLGSRAILSTRPRNSTTQEHILLIDWKDFESAKIVEDVVLEIETSKASGDTLYGTVVHLEDLSERITRSSVARLARELVLLADPFGDNPSGFKPVLVAPEFSDLERLVRQRYFEDAEYHLIASIDKDGVAKASIVDWKGNVLFSAAHEDLSKDGGSYRCPQATFDLWVFLLDAATFSTRKSTIGEVRKWLEAFGGVHLYQNQLRVSPYGDPGSDWLGLNLARARSPEVRPSTNTVIGRVVFSDIESILVQKTDRSGFIETDTFQELRRFAQDSCEWMARRRLEVAQLRRAKERASAHQTEKPSKHRLFAAIDEVPEPLRKRIKDAAEQHESVQESDKEKLRREVQLYRTLSTAGITAATFAHESRGNPLKSISLAISAIDRRTHSLGADSPGLSVAKPVAAIKRAVERLAVLGAVTSKLLDHEKRRFSRVDLCGTIADVLETFKPFTQGRDVEVIPELGKFTPYLHGSEAAIESIITNLINNSLAAFEDSASKERKIVVRANVEGNFFYLHVLDNGPGITGVSKRDIWLPGVTTRRNGTGLGLSIVKDTVLDLGGEVDAVEHSAMGGAEIIVKLPVAET